MRIFKRFVFVIFPLSFPVLLFSGSQADSSLAPWTGVWAITQDESAGSGTDLNSSAAVEIRPTTDGKGLEISRKIAQQPEVKEIVIPDGVKRQVEAQGCTGWQTASWIPEAGSIISSSEMNCTESGSFATSGLRVILAADQMVDILGIKVGGQTRLVVRRLKFRQGLTSDQENKASLALAAARAAASAPWSVDDIIQLSDAVDDAVLQAGLIEKDVQLNLTSKSLKELQAAKVSKGIIDLLVALAFPDRFDIQKNGQVALSSRSVFTTGAFSGGSFPTGIDFYPGTFYSCPNLYGRYFGVGYQGILDPGLCWSYYSPFWWDYPIYFNGRPGNQNGEKGIENNARLSAGSGYVQIEPRDTGRHAVPRYNSTSSRKASSGSASDSSSSGSSSASSSESSSSSSDSGASASPGGYSSGSSGRRAVPRQ